MKPQAAPAPVTVGPFTFLPMNAAALMLLSFAKSPFVTGEQPCAERIIMDLSAAVYILSTPCATVRADMEADQLTERLWETAAQIPAMTADELALTVSSIAQHVQSV